MRWFRQPIYIMLLNIWFYKWLYRYQLDKKSLKLVVYLQTFLIIFTWIITIPILLIVYSGVIIYRKRILRKFHFYIGNQFNKTFHTKYHKLFGVMLILLYFIGLMFLLALLFTIPILFLMFIGAKIEKKREFRHRNKTNKAKFVYQYIENETDKKESKTIGYINEN